MFEAAAAHYQATGKKTFLTIATRYADYIDSVFGPPPKRLGYPGHPEIELALIKLWRATGNQRYFELARFFVENAAGSSLPPNTTTTGQLRRFLLAGRRADL